MLMEDGRPARLYLVRHLSPVSEVQGLRSDVRSPNLVRPALRLRPTLRGLLLLLLLLQLQLT
jgi:hypothetical protein